jgi:hypothetical protein
VQFSGNEKNSLTSPDTTPGISYNLSVTVTSNGTDQAASVRINGAVDTFPAYEVVVVRPEAGTRSTTTLQDPSKTGDTPAGLYSLNQKSVDTVVWIDPKKKQ